MKDNEPPAERGRFPLAFWLILAGCAVFIAGYSWWRMG